MHFADGLFEPDCMAAIIAHCLYGECSQDFSPTCFRVADNLILRFGTCACSVFSTNRECLFRIASSET